MNRTEIGARIGAHSPEADASLRFLHQTWRPVSCEIGRSFGEASTRKEFLLSKQLRFSGAVAVPDSASQAALLVGQVAQYKQAFEQAVSSIFGQAFVLDDKITNERGKRAEKSEAEPEAAA